MTGIKQKQKNKQTLRKSVTVSKKVRAKQI